jgi:hypothetical protein
MRLILFILIVLLIAQVGFWHALGAIIGAVAMLFLLAFLAIPVIVIGGVLLVAASLR